MNLSVGRLNRFILLIFCLLWLAACQTSVNETPAPSKEVLLRTETITPISTQTITKTELQNPTTINPTSSPEPSPTPATQNPTIPPADRRVILMAVGDIMLGRTIGDIIEKEGHEAPFQYVAETLNTADVAIGNLECPISDRGVAEEKTYAFRAPVNAGKSLAFGGFDVVSLANNHTLDYGPLALRDTMDILHTNQIHSVGAGMHEVEAYSPVFVEKNGLRLAFLAYADIPPAVYDYQAWEAGPNKPGIAWAHEDRIVKGVTAAKTQADLVIVLVHNGFEFMQQVTAEQQKVARLAIDSGASLVIGSHPHVLQRIEAYGDGLIAYSMGNFVFDNMLFPPNYSAILVVELSLNGIESYELIDVIVQLNGIPQIMPYRQYD